MAENEILVALRGLTDVSSAVQDGNTYTVIFTNSPHRLIVTYMEIPNTRYPHAITFTYTSSSDVDPNRGNTVLYQFAIRSPQVQSGIIFQVIQFNQYMTTPQFRLANT